MCEKHLQAPYAGGQTALEPQRDTQVTVTDPVLQRGAGGGQVRCRQRVLPPSSLSARALTRCYLD
jgi:hypothetical protein